MKKTKYLIGIAVLLVITLGIAFLINESYRTGTGYITLWEPADTLSFYGSYLSFIGTVILGLLAVYQNHKANILNQQMQKLQQAQFVSMVSVEKVMLSVRGKETPCFYNSEMKNVSKNIINVTANDFDSNNNYHIDVRLKNESEYPIVQMQVHPGVRGSIAGQLYGMKNMVDQAIYIASGESEDFRFIVPAKLSMYYEGKLAISIDFINVFDYVTPATLHISNLNIEGNIKDYKYRLSKFTDIKPHQNQ